MDYGSNLPHFGSPDVAQGTRWCDVLLIGARAAIEWAIE
jgi:hypothetical protein